MSCIARWLIQVFTYRCGDRRALGGEHSGKHDIASMESLDHREAPRALATGTVRRKALPLRPVRQTPCKGGLSARRPSLGGLGLERASFGGSFIQPPSPGGLFYETPFSGGPFRQQPFFGHTFGHKATNQNPILACRRVSCRRARGVPAQRSACAPRMHPWSAFLDLCLAHDAMLQAVRL